MARVSNEVSNDDLGTHTDPQLCAAAAATEAEAEAGLRAMAFAMCTASMPSLGHSHLVTLVRVLLYN